MPSITLRKGSAAGPEITFSLGFINLDDLTAGTDYVLESEGEITLGIGGKLKVGNIRLAGVGFDALDLTSATDLIDSPRWVHDSVVTPDRYFPAGTFVPETIGVQPDDWELRWRDKYYTLVTRTQDGHDIYTYMPLTSGTWNDNIQYYSNETASALYWTPNAGFFGVRTFYSSTSTTKTATVCAGSYTSYGYTSTIKNGPISCRLKNIDGTEVCMLSDGVQHYWRPYRSEQSTYSTTGTARLRAVLVLVQLDGKNYPALAVIGYGIDEAVNYVGMWYADSRFWTSDDIQPSTPGDWGASAGAIKPTSGGTPSFASVGVNISFPSALNSASYGGTAGGVNLWAMDASDYGSLNDFLWTENFLSRMSHLGRSPGDGIIAVHGMPETDYAGTSMGLRLYGIPTTLTAAHLKYRTRFVSLGTVKIPFISRIYSDYSAKIEIYLPFCGTYTLDPQKVIGGTLGLTYGFDFATGAVLAQLEVTKAYPDTVTKPTGTTLILTASGNAAASMPYAYTDGGVQGKLSALSGALTAGLSAASGSAAGILSGSMQILQGLGQSQHISASAATGNAGALGGLQPFVWVQYPEPLNPAAYGQTVGYMSSVGGTVGTPQTNDLGEQTAFSGFQQFEAVDVDGITGATQEELQEIETLLKGGVFV